MSHSIKPGVATGDDVQTIFKYAKSKGFALPAVNVVGSSSINAAMETAAKVNGPIIIQFSILPGLCAAGCGGRLAYAQTQEEDLQTSRARCH